eukprot:jgi/Psemu1/30428/gm1.30428_g
MPANLAGGGINDRYGDNILDAISLPSFDGHMKLILVSIFRVTKEDDSLLCEALLEGGLHEWSTFLDELLEHGFARELTYMDESSGLPTQLHRSIQRTIEALADFTKDLRKSKTDWRDVESYLYGSFSAFCMTCALRTNKNKSPQQVKYESWCQKSRDEKLFMPLTNDSRFEHWLVGFKAKLKSYDIDIETFLDETWPPAALQGFARDLFVKQCAFFWVLMLEVFKSDLSASCVHSHSITRNGWQAYFDFVNLHSESKAKLNHLNKLRPPNKPLEYHTIKSALCQACYSSFQLSKQFAKVNDPGGPNSTVTDIVAEATAIHKLKITLLLEATRLGSQSTMSAPKSTVRAHVHGFSSNQGHNSSEYALPIEFEGDYHDYAVFKAGRSPDPTTRLPSGIWKALSQGKKIVVASLRSELLPESQPDPNAIKPITRKAYTHEHSVTFLEDDTSSSDNHTNASEDLHLAVENDRQGVFHASLGVYKSQTSSSKDHQPLKSSVSPAHPARFLSENPDIQYKRDGDTLVPLGKSSDSVNFHQWYKPKDDLTLQHNNHVSAYTYRAHKATVSNPGIAMVDRGANGCIIGNDACLISKDIPPWYVNVTGINNHQVQNIPIATCGAYSVSNRGPIILIFNECAYTGRHPSILSSSQMEAYFSTVDDTSIKAGGGQVITTTDGYALPLSICHGLPYLTMRKYTTDEFNALPHVIMKSDKHWDPSVLDTIISAKDETFLQKYPPQPQQLPYPTYDEYGNPRCLEGLDISVSLAFLPINDHGINDHSFWLTPTDYDHQERLACCIPSPTSDMILAFPTACTADDTPHVATTPRERYPNERDYLSLKPFFCWVSTDRIKATFANSTQYGSLAVSPDGNLFKRFHSPQLAMNVLPFNDDVLSDVVSYDVPAINGGSKLAQIFFGRKSHRDAPLRLLCDHGSYQSSKRVINYLKMLWIGFWQSEPYHQHQNQFERRYQRFKRIVNRVMDRTGTPPHLWLLCMTYVAGLLNVISDPTLSDKQPVFIATGSLGDISTYTSFFWFEPFDFKTNDSPFGTQSTERLGHFVGIAEHVGNGLCFQIWDPVTNKLLDPSGVCSALAPESRNKRAGLFTDDGFVAWHAPTEKPKPQDVPTAPTTAESTTDSDTKKSFNNPAAPDDNKPPAPTEHQATASSTQTPEDGQPPASGTQVIIKPPAILTSHIPLERLFKDEYESDMPFKKNRASGNTVPPRKREKKSTLLVVRQQREANNANAADLGGTGVNPTSGGAAESTEDIDPETYKEPTPPVATTQKHVRLSIAQRLNAIAHICDHLRNNTTSFRHTVSQVCTEILHYVDNGTVYTGDGNYSNSGRLPVIAVDSIEAEIIADSIESGNSIHVSRLIVKNQYRRRCELPSLTYWANNKMDAWCRASFRWFAQFLLRFGEIDFSHPIFQKLLGPAYVKEKPPPCYDTSLLTPLKLSQVVWFDELHKQCHIDIQKLQQHNLRLVCGLKALSGNTSQIRTIPGSISGISFERLSAFVCAAESCLDGSSPPVVHHSEASNPYLSLYREDSWEEQCDKDCMTGKMCVTEMIHFMFDQTKEILGENSFVYHNALVLMTLADSILYMKDKGYDKNWILPELDLVEECGGLGGALKAYWNRPVGNPLEANPLDTSLFSQLNRAVDQHVILTQDFTDEDKKFSLATPGAISAAEGVADPSGKRHIRKDQHGGRRVRKLKDDCYDEETIELHKGAEDARNRIVEKAEAKFYIKELFQIKCYRIVLASAQPPVRYIER